MGRHLKSSYKSCVILGAGAPHQGGQPALLESVSGVTVTNWLCNAISAPEVQVYLVLGYHFDDIAQAYPGIKSVVNPSWESTGSTESLFLLNLENVTDLLVCYGDVLFRSQLVDGLRQIDAPVVVAWDSLWKKRYVDRAREDIEASEKVLVTDGVIQRAGQDVPVDWANGEFIGVVRFSGAALDYLRQLQRKMPDSLRRTHLSCLVEWLRVAGISVVGFDVLGDWAEVNQPKDIAQFVLGTKGETLARLRSVVTTAVIQDQYSFCILKWDQSRENLLHEIREKFADTNVVVRSSARSEDSFTHSNAGAYTSVLNVDIRSDLESAIERVVASYHDKQPDDQVLVQPMIKNVVVNGVAFTRTLEWGAPWYVINYEESVETDGITSGNSVNQRVFYMRRDAKLDEVADIRLKPLVSTLREIEGLVGYDALDVEFALDCFGKVHILQVRPIAVEHNNERELTEKVVEVVNQAENQWEMLLKSSPHILGDNPIYGVMPDWNPAEIIGTNPGKLSESLYRYLILDEIWAVQRAEYGYRDVRPSSLLVNFAGKPYVDVRASFNSFVPADVPDSLAERLVNFYLSWLRRYPHLHDKIEFDVVPTCLGLNFGSWRQRLSKEAGLDEDELNCLQDSLRRITANAIERTKGYLENLNSLEKRYVALNAINPTQSFSFLRKMRSLLDDCRILGTLPFAHLARSGFVAVTLLKDAVTTGVITCVARDQFMASLRTVSHKLHEDSRNVASGKMAWGDFVEKYGHLRPGTYDILSPAYRDDPDKYLRPLLASAVSAEDVTVTTERWQQEKGRFFFAVRAQGLDYSDELLEQFLRDSIEGRETAKFAFTRNLSAALDVLAHWGEMNGVSRQELSNLSLFDFFEIAKEVVLHEDQRIEMLNNSAKAALQRKVALACELPALICEVKDFYSFLLQRGQPNFIGSVRVVANCINLSAGHLKDHGDLAGCIVIIHQADPGYDWLFSQGIVGLVTMYGGANSHMAIRAAEFGLPAAIGIGEQLYSMLIKSRVLELDPANSRLTVLH